MSENVAKSPTKRKKRGRPRKQRKFINVNSPHNIYPNLNIEVESDDTDYDLSSDQEKNTNCMSVYNEEVAIQHLSNLIGQMFPRDQQKRIFKRLLQSPQPKKKASRYRMSKSKIIQDVTVPPMDDDTSDSDFYDHLDSKFGEIKPKLKEIAHAYYFYKKSNHSNESRIEFREQCLLLVEQFGIGEIKTNYTSIKQHIERKRYISSFILWPTFFRHVQFARYRAL